MVTVAIYQCVLIHPTDTGGIRPQLRARVGRQLAGRLVEIFQYPRACPVGVGAVLENDVDKGITEERIAADINRPGYRQHGGSQRIGDLVLDHLRCLSRVAGLDNDLHV